MPKPTFASVTEEACTCNYLQNAADDPDHPIVFDAQTGEYQFAYQQPECEGLSSVTIYHCPFCGGAAPESKRELLFAVIPKAEEDRLLEILAPIQTIESALQTLGQPDFDDFISVKKSEKNGSPPSVKHYRQIRYNNLSDVAEVWITDRPDGRASWQLQGKYVGTKTQ
jgi:hypothetical protein